MNDTGLRERCAGFGLTNGPGRPGSSNQSGEGDIRCALITRVEQKIQTTLARIWGEPAPIA